MTLPGVWCKTVEKNLSRKLRADFWNSNQTNLALKGIIGIQAMSEIAGLVGNSDDKKKYSDIATDYIDKWQDLGIADHEDPPHTTLSYGRNETWGKGGIDSNYLCH